MTTNTTTRVVKGQVWQSKQKQHADLRVVVERTNPESRTAKVRTLKNRHTNSMGGSRSNRDKPWHVGFDMLGNTYQLIKDVHTHEKPEVEQVAQYSEARKDAVRRAHQDRFDSLDDATRREIMDARKARMDKGEIMRAYGISPQVLGMLTHWASEHYQESLILDPKPTKPKVTEQTNGQHADSYPDATRPLEELWVEPAFTPAGVADMPVPTGTARFKVKMLVSKPVEIERMVFAVNFAQVEQQIQEYVEHVVEVLSIEKLR